MKFIGRKDQIESIIAADLARGLIVFSKPETIAQRVTTLENRLEDAESRIDLLSESIGQTNKEAR